MNARKLITSGLLLALVLSFLQPIFVQQTKAASFNEKWYQVSYNSKSYNDYVTSSSPLSGLFKRPLSRYTDSAYVTKIYVMGTDGSSVSDKTLARQLVIDAQNDARFAAYPDVSFQDVIQLSLQKDIRSGYSIYVPTALPDWWKAAFLYLGFGLDYYSSRVEMWKNVLLEVILQTALHDKISDDRELLKELGSMLHDSDVILDWSTKIMAGDQNFHLPKADVESLLDLLNRGHHTLNEKVLLEFNRLSAAVGAVTTAYDIAADAFRFYMLGTLANAQAQERLDQLDRYLQSNAGSVDSALLDGMTRAKAKFQEVKNAYYDTVYNTLKSAWDSIANHLVDLGYAVAGLAGAFAGAGFATVAAVIMPYYLSYKVYRMLADSIDKMQSACLASTLERMLAGQVSSVAGLPSYRAQVSAAGYPDDALTKTSMELFNINHYLGFYFHQKIAEGMDLPVYKQLGDFFSWLLGGSTVSDAINYNLQRADQEALYTGETRAPWYLSGFKSLDWDDYEWLLQMAGVTPAMIMSTSTNKGTYEPSEQVTLTTSLVDQDTIQLNSASVSYVVKDTGGLTMLSGSLSNVAPGSYQGSFAAPPTPSTYQILTTASKEGYPTATSSISFNVIRLAQGHDLNLRVLSVDNTNPTPGGSVGIRTQVNNDGIYEETVSASISIAGPSYSFATSVGLGNLKPGYSTGIQTIYHWSVPGNAQNGYYTITVTVQGMIGDENPSNNVKSTSVYVSWGGAPSYSAYSYEWRELTWNDNYDLTPYGALFKGAYGPATYYNPFNGHTYTIAPWGIEGPGGNVNSGTPPETARCWIFISRDDGAIIWTPNWPNNPRRVAIYNYFDNNALIVDLELLMDPTIYIKVGSPTASASISPFRQSCQVTKQVTYQVSVPSVTAFDWNPETMFTDGSDQPIISKNPVTWLQISPSASQGPFNVIARPQTSGTYSFAIDSGGPISIQYGAIYPASYIVFGKLDALDIYDSSLSGLTISPNNPQTGDTVLIRNTIVDRGTAPLTNVALHTVVTGPSSYLKEFSGTVSAGETTFTWDTTGAFPGSYTITSTIDSSKDSDSSNNMRSIPMTLLPPPPPPDMNPPETYTLPIPSVFTIGSLTISWTGQDNTTSVSDLTYSYCLVGYDASWSSWVSNKDKQYTGLADGNYTFKVKARDLAGNEDPTPAEEAFRIDTTPPIITSANPTGTNVPVAGLVVRINFSEYMNHALVEGAFSISPSVAGTFSWDGKTALFTSSSNLAYAMTYHVILDARAADVAGNPLQAPFEWQFTTIPPIQYTLLVEVKGSGTTNATGTQKHNSGSLISVKASANAGWLFGYWLRNGTNMGSANPYTVTLNGNVNLTAVFLVGGPMFDDSFESGSFSNWSDTIASSGETATVLNTLPHQGAYSALFASDGGGGFENAYCYKTITAIGDLYARGCFRVTTSGMLDDGDRVYFIVFKAGTSNLAYAGWRQTGGVAKWNLIIRDGTSWVTAYSTASPSLNQWYCVELHWKKDASNGLGELWVDGVLTCSASGKNTAYYGDANRISFGIAESVNCGPNQIHGDCCIASTSYVDPDLPQTLLNDGFESGSFGNWTGTGLSAGETAVVTNSLAHHGTFDAMFTSNGNGGSERASCNKTIVASTEIYARGYFRAGTSGIADNDDRHYFMIFRAGSTGVAFAGWRQTGGVIKWSLIIRHGTSWLNVYSTTSPSLNQWYCVELHWKGDAANGLCELWINGTIVCSITGKNTAYYGTVNRVDFGLAEIVNCASTTAYCDCCMISRAYIGPEPTSVMFSNGFESGSFSNWTGTGLSSGETATVTNTMPYNDKYSALFTTNGNGGSEYAYCYKTITPSSDLYVRGYFRVETSGIVENDDRFSFIVIKAGGNGVAYAGWRQTGGILKWQLIVRHGSSYVIVYSTSSPSLNHWYLVELHWKKDAANGMGELWVDGALVASVAGMNTAYYGDANRVDFGIASMANCGNTSVYADCATISTTHVGPIARDKWL